MNRVEALKATRDGLDVQEDLVRFAREGWRTIADDDKERLKWVGVFHRKPTPGGHGGPEPRAAAKILEDVPCDELPEVLDRLLRFFPRAERKEEAP